MSSTWLGEEQITGKLIEFPGKVITCVSQLPSGEGFGFGDEEGWLHFSGVDDSSPSSKPIKVIESDRPLNQIAFSTFEGQKFIAASSASNIAIHNLSRQGESSPHLRTEFVCTESMPRAGAVSSPPLALAGWRIFARSRAASSSKIC